MRYDKMKGYRKVLIAVNGSSEVLHQGLKLADEEKCWVTVIKVIPPYEGDLDLTGIKKIEDVLDSGGSAAVTEIKRAAVAERALVKTRLEEGDPSRKIIEVAEEERCDLIIVGARKRSWLRKITGDNVVNKVISRSPCPVLVVGAEAA
jgi:nucleotide-binding universal stress UspA family protein